RSPQPAAGRAAADANAHPAAASAGARRKPKHACAAGLTRCVVGKGKHGKHKHVCVDLHTDPRHCGQCATTCAADETCQGGQCGSSACPGGQVVCGGHCTDTQSDPTNCGACGALCESGNCQRGQCGCPAGLTNCNGRCIPTSSDPTNCGACGTVCPGNGPHGQATCSDSACGLTCDPGYFDCGGACVDVANDPTNCGACGRICSFPHATAACGNGACAIGACDQGFADCDNDPSTGCEVDISSDHNNCGACGVVCGGTKAC
ncbi:MAG TPA: hypothetical protein VFU81_17515, partial [Thermomicrobiales bacterium]|nr:hypothetical protein [Thermomicrobiales bacterium]